MLDHELQVALKALHAAGLERPVGVTHQRLLAQCRDEINCRLFAEDVNFQVWISRLVRDMYLSEDALRQGHGVEELCEFWAWFDGHMWSNDIPNYPLAAAS